MELQTIKDRAKDWLYYIIIGIVSFLAVVVLPLFGSELDMGPAFPNTAAGWMIWIVTKSISAIINVLIFHCFMRQAKINIKDNEHYQEACAILLKQAKKEKMPRSPGKWNTIQYGWKGTTIFLFTALSTIVLTDAIIKCDWTVLLAYTLTVTMGIVFGILQMKKAELYWTTEFWEYAKMMEEKDD